jgi:hypothetical protein
MKGRPAFSLPSMKTRIVEKADGLTQKADETPAGKGES